MNENNETKRPVWRDSRVLISALAAVGVLACLYVIAAASVQPDASRPGAVERHADLAVGEMADFTFAFPPRGAPTEQFTGPDGKPQSLQDFRGKTVLVNFWATWCAPCLEELPSLDALQQEMGGKDFEVVAIAADPRGPKAAQTFLDRLGVSHLTVRTDASLSLAMAVGGVDALPVSVLYDAKGNEIGRLTGGADWAGEDAKRLVEAAIEGKAKRR